MKNPLLMKSSEADFYYKYDVKYEKVHLVRRIEYDPFSCHSTSEQLMAGFLHRWLTSALVKALCDVMFPSLCVHACEMHSPIKVLLKGSTRAITIIISSCVPH